MKTTQKNTRGGDHKSNPDPDQEIWIRGHEIFTGLTGFKKEWIKAVRATPEGCKVFRGRNDIALYGFCRASNLLQREQKGEPQTESEARTKKLNAETRAIEREEALENKVIQIESEVDANFRHVALMPLRDGLQGLQKKYHRLKTIQPDIAQTILENDLPLLVKKLCVATDKANDPAT